MDKIGCLMVLAQGGVLCSPLGGDLRRVTIENPADGRYPLIDQRHSVVVDYWNLDLRSNRNDD